MDRKKLLLLANLGTWLAAGVYTVSPIDLLPDFIPLIGWMDDFVSLAVAVAFTIYTVRSLKNGEPAVPRVAVPARPRGPTIEMTPGDSGYEPMSADEIAAL